MEEWRSIDGYPMYEVSSYGNVRSFYMHGKLLRPVYCGQSRYPAVTLHDSKNVKTKKTIHTLVLTAFIGPKPTPEHESAHLDGNNQNNHVLNLAWKTHQENIDDKKIHGTSPIGELNAQAKLTADIIRIIRKEVANGVTQTSLARRYKVSISAVNNAIRGLTWRHA